MLYSYQERPDEAEDAYRRALAVLETSLGRDHPSVASVLNVLGSLCDDQGRFAEAEQMTVRAISIRETALGPDHPLLAEALFNLAHIYHRHFNKLDEAEELYKRALAISRAVFGPQDPDVAVSVEEYAALLREQGREEELAELEQHTPTSETPIVSDSSR
jgi:tetratricopeptide (TPR) repeat protein